jgi:peptidoglycan hydrolase-like protein with peptidoglycan-binding domain
MMKDEFINSIKEGALRGYEEYGILPSLTIAQAALESGWGTSQLSIRANNLFGIKAFSDWAGRRVNLPTAEWYGDQMKIVSADFRVYDSLNESIEDHNKLLSYSRYKPLHDCIEYKAACQSIYECGYATDPRYPEKLISIIEQYLLYDLDGVRKITESSAGITGNKIRKFQRLCNVLGIRDSEGRSLVEDNILGEKTKSCIEKMPVLMGGSQGEAVEFIQKVIGAHPVDGDFGPITQRRVLEYQRDKNIDADGVVGVHTWTFIVTT